MQYSLFVQYAKALTPAEIIVLDRSPEALTLTRQWGADHQVLADGRHIEKVREITNGQGAEAVIDFVGEGGAVAAFWFRKQGSASRTRLTLPCYGAALRSFSWRRTGTIEGITKEGALMNRQFCLTHVVRYDECNCDGLLTPAAFLRYMQDIAAQDAEDARLSGNGYWVVKRTVISFLAPVQIHTQLLLKTYGIRFTRITAQRGYEAHLAGEDTSEPVVSAHTLWVYVDSRGRPARLPERTAEIWLPDGPLPQQPDIPLPPFPESIPATTSYSVRFSDIDPMRHLNNASAVEMLDNAGWEACVADGITPDTARLNLRHYDIEYLDSPRYGETLNIQSWHDPFPLLEQDFTRLQQITREGNTMVRARSRWKCDARNAVLQQQPS